MKRRTFVKLTTSASIALYLPGLDCKPKDSTFTRVLSQPNALQHVCDAATIRQIGEAYQKKAGDETSRSALTKLLTADPTGSHIDDSTDSVSIVSYLNKRVQQDFQQNKTVVVNGWVLSLTEARQCALFSLTAK